MNTERLLANIARWMTTAGITVLLANICSRLLFANSSFDTPEREAWFGAMAVSALLTILWVIIAAVFFAIRRRKTGILFQIALAMNLIVALLLFAEFYSST